jgi:peptidoglycan/xylan/chitin deacetylase (PgdA/CDA1 family)
VRRRLEEDDIIAAGSFLQPAVARCRQPGIGLPDQRDIAPSRSDRARIVGRTIVDHHDQLGPASLCRDAAQGVIADLLEVARDELQPRGIAPIAFAVTGVQSNEWGERIGAARMELLDATGLHALRECGAEIGCHSHSHRLLTELGDEELAAETAGAAEELERAGLPRPAAFAYPYGVRDERSRQAVEAAGFDVAFGLRRGFAGRGSDRLDLPRVEILAHDAGWRFRAKTAFPRLSAWVLR